MSAKVSRAPDSSPIVARNSGTAALALAEYRSVELGDLGKKTETLGILGDEPRGGDEDQPGAAVERARDLAIVAAPCGSSSRITLNACPYVCGAIAAPAKNLAASSR